MVNWCARIWLLAAEQPSKTVLEQLDPERRVAVVLALVSLGLLGALLVALILLGGRWARHGRPTREHRPTAGGRPAGNNRGGTAGGQDAHSPDPSDTVVDPFGNDTTRS